MMYDRPHRAIKHIWKLLKAEQKHLRSQIILGEHAFVGAKRLRDMAAPDATEAYREDNVRWVSRCKATLTRDRSKLAELESTIVGYEAILEHISTKEK